MDKASCKTHDEVVAGAKAMKELRKHAQNVEKDNQETVQYIKALNKFKRLRAFALSLSFFSYMDSQLLIYILCLCFVTFR